MRPEYRDTISNELRIRIILQAREEHPVEQAAIERSLGGSHLTDEMPRPYKGFTEAQLLRYTKKLWKIRDGW